MVVHHVILIALIIGAGLSLVLVFIMPVVAAFAFIVLMVVGSLATVTQSQPRMRKNWKPKPVKPTWTEDETVVQAPDASTTRHRNRHKKDVRPR